MLYIDNDGPLIARTNYFDLPHARAGMMFASWNNGGFRLLLPDALLHALPEMRASKRVFAWAAMVEGGRATNLLFDDGGGPRPLTLWIGDEQCFPVPPLRATDPWPREPFRLLVYTSAGLGADLPGLFGRPRNIRGLAK